MNRKERGERAENPLFVVMGLQSFETAHQTTLLRTSCRYKVDAISYKVRGRYGSISILSQA